MYLLLTIDRHNIAAHHCMITRAILYSKVNLILTRNSYITSILGFKLSLLYSFLRIAVVKYYRVTIICIAAACTAFHICFLIVQLNLCNPVS